MKIDEVTRVFEFARDWVRGWGVRGPKVRTG